MNVLAAAVTLLAIGDSISAGVNSWYQYMPPNVTVINRAIPGSSFTDWLGYRDGCFGPPVICGVPASHWAKEEGVDVVHIYLGGNDATGFLDSNEPFDATRKTEHMLMLSKLVRISYPDATVIVSQTLRIFTASKTIQIREAFLGNMIAAGAGEGHWKMGMTNNILMPDEYSDGLHPNESGKKSLAASFITVLQYHVPKMRSSKPASHEHDI